MAKRASRPQRATRSGGRREKKDKTGLYVALAIGGLAIIGLLVWCLIPQNSSTFSRSQLDEYIMARADENQMSNGQSVYLDFSDGMNSAYATADSKLVLQSIINKLNGPNSAVEFFNLSNNKITLMAEYSQTELYNYVMASSSYSKSSAPIEKALETIIAKKQPALLVTDYEEYNNGKIHRAAYAKDYFTRWLSMGYNITFYKWDFTEGKKDKHMYLTVFDNNYGSLQADVATAIEYSGINLASNFIDKFEIGSKEFAYPTGTNYLSAKQGGNYHNSKGTDAISSVNEDGGPEAFISYCQPIGTADSKKSHDYYSQLSNKYGVMAQYYPLRQTWTDILNNARSLSEHTNPSERYRHFISDLYVNFTTQNGYTISGIEARAFNVNDEVINFKDSTSVSLSDSKPILDAFTATLEPVYGTVNGIDGWDEICLDFDPRFDGTFAKNIAAPNDLIVVNIVISKAEARIDTVDDFFGWEGNPSLSASVKNTLLSREVNPEGRVLMSYYLKVML